MKDSVSIHAIWLAQDDVKKNTAVKLSRRDLLRLHKDFRRLPRRGILLDPLCGKVFGPEDHALLNSATLVGLDCSWAQIDYSVATVKKRTRLTSRMLPLLLAANPVQVEHYRAGKKKVLGFFVGQIMKQTRGKGNPAVINRLLKKKLNE